MTDRLDAAIATLTTLGGDAVHDRYDEFVGYLVEILEADRASIRNFPAFHAALVHGFSYFYWKWDPRAGDLHQPLSSAISRWGTEPEPPIGLLCDLVDFIFFVVWCFEESSTRQCELLVEPLRNASLSFARSVPSRALPLPARSGPYRIAWLGMYAQTDNPMSIALREIGPGICAAGHRLDVYAWRFRDEAYLDHLRSKGALVHEFPAATTLETIQAIEAKARLDGPEIVISDMNNGLPTALFSRRLAPVQIFLQAGMPAWPVQNLDGVFNSFGFDRHKAGWGDVTMLRLDDKWDLESLNPPVAEADIAAERAVLPSGSRLIGSYGRFSKVTLPYLQAVEQILLRCPDVTFVLGGTGDASHVRAFKAQSPAGSRMHLEERYVSGHVWGHILELLLDTWPVTGGVSAREMLAKSRPVVTLHSEEMPAMDRQRDPSLVAISWQEFAHKAVHLLQDETAYAAAAARAGALVRRFGERGNFARDLNADILNTVRRTRFRRSAIGLLYSRILGLSRPRGG